MTYAYYDEYGDITSVCSHAFDGGRYVEVPIGTTPDEIWIDPASGEIHAREPHEWPEIVDIEDGLAIPVVDCCATFVNGTKQPAGSVFIPESPGRYIVHIKGRRAGSKSVLFASYAEQRKLAYPSISDQLDTLYHEGYDAWRAKIAAIKEAYPKN